LTTNIGVKMEFNIKNLQLDTFQTGSWSTSLSNVVGIVEYEFIETLNSKSITKTFFQPLDFRGWNSSSFVEYNDLNKEQVKGWVTSSFETLKTEVYTSENNIHHPTGSWSSYLNSMSSSLYSQLTGSQNDNQNKLPW
tara:strand:+ start:238 stop:648 length:411 start_codon:yes stop_codon:yes gene_type:complete